MERLVALIYITFTTPRFATELRNRLEGATVTKSLPADSYTWVFRKYLLSVSTTLRHQGQAPTPWCQPRAMTPTTSRGLLPARCIRWQLPDLETPKWANAWHAGLTRKRSARLDATSGQAGYL